MSCNEPQINPCALLWTCLTIFVIAAVAFAREVLR
jgi:hypothetical protein